MIKHLLLCLAAVPVLAQVDSPAWVGPATITPEVNQWKARTGVSVSSKTLQSLSLFLIDLQRTGLRSKIKAANCFVPDSIAACATALITNKGNSVWVNNNFVAGDLTVNGLKGNGSNKYLATGVIPDSTFTTNNCGVSYYIYDGTPTNANDLGSVNSGGQQLVFSMARSGENWYADCWNNTTTRSQGSVAVSNCLVTLNRQSDYSITVLTNGVVLTNKAPAGVQSDYVPVSEIFIFCANHNSTPEGFTDKRLSFVAFHDALTTNESALLFTAVQKLRTNLGGGYR